MTSAERNQPARRQSSFESAPNAEEIVATKLSEFARDRLALTQAMARKFKVDAPPELEQFFAAAEAGRWDDVKTLFGALRERRSTNESLNKLWGPILETYGTAEIAHDWPAQKLLDYGQAVLGSLREGMVYSGGTDPGRFIPTLLNETGDGEHHIVVTQNALADNSYREYFDFLYHDRLGTLSEVDSQRAFSEYMADAQKRLAHDQQFPDEPKQVRPGEDIRVIDGRVQVSGQVAVMAINEKLFQMLMDKNPDLSFAMEESFPFQSMYSAAVPLGPIMELRAPSSQEAYSAEAASQAVDYWRTAQQIIGDSEADSDVRMAYAKMASAQAGLLADHNLNAEADQAYRVATEICPSSPEAVFRYVNLLLTQNRLPDAVQVAQRALMAAPDNLQFHSLVENLQRSVNGNR
jgi:tetratricopeptide (TPR) repeat protein